MQYTQLGRTGLQVSRLCLGTMNFGPQTSEADSFTIMDQALELGLNFFDTANVYGGKRGEGITEQIIGRWLAQGGGRREQIVLATKVYNTMGDRPAVVPLRPRGNAAYPEPPLHRLVHPRHTEAPFPHRAQQPEAPQPLERLPRAA